MTFEYLCNSCYSILFVFELWQSAKRLGIPLQYNNISDCSATSALYYNIILCKHKVDYDIIPNEINISGCLLLISSLRSHGGVRIKMTSLSPLRQGLNVRELPFQEQQGKNTKSEYYKYN